MQSASLNGEGFFGCDEDKHVTTPPNGHVQIVSALGSAQLFGVIVKSFFFCLLFINSALAKDAEPSVTKIIFRMVAADLSPASLSAAPKTIYLAGDRYARIEQQVDAQSKDSNLIIVNGANIWVIDAKNKRGGHMLNKGPDTTVHNPILGPDGPEELFSFEYGKEIAFFEKASAKRVASQSIEGIECEGRELILGNYRVLLYSGRAKSPVKVQIFRDGEVVFELRYISYERGLPFDGSLFVPPGDIQISESAE